MVFNLEHEHALRVQLGQTGETTFEIRLELHPSADANQVFTEIKESVRRVFNDNGVLDVVIGLSGELPKLGASGKFHEVLALRR